MGNPRVSQSAWTLTRLGEVFPVSIWLMVPAATPLKDDRSRMEYPRLKRWFFSSTPILCRFSDDIGLLLSFL